MIILTYFKNNIVKFIIRLMIKIYILVIKYTKLIKIQFLP